MKTVNREAMPTAAEGEDRILDMVWIRSNGQAIEVQDMNEFHAKNALRILIRAFAEGDVETIKEHLEI